MSSENPKPGYQYELPEIASLVPRKVEKANFFYCLTVRQPWASLIFSGRPTEVRTWETSYRGPVLVHAGKTIDPQAVEHLRIREIGPQGKILGVVDLTRIEQITDPGMWETLKPLTLEFNPLPEARDICF